MPRRPEIGNIQLYPNRPLQKSDRNGYVLKFYCPIQQKRIRRNCGTRDRRIARRILRECRERLLNGRYVASSGAITAEQEQGMPLPSLDSPETRNGNPATWQDCLERYRQHRTTRVRDKSLTDAMSRLNIAERIFEGYRDDRRLQGGLLVSQCMTLDMLEYLQDRLLAGDESRFDVRSPNTVNSMLGAIVAFGRFCAKHEWVDQVPAVDKLDVEDVMKGRPISGEEFERMLEITSRVVGVESAASWEFALRILWETGFRVGDLLDFSWDDDRFIHPVWSRRQSVLPTIVIPGRQKNRRVQEIPMLPGLEKLLSGIPKSQRTGWIVNPLSIQYEIRCESEFIRPTDEDLKLLAIQFSNSSIARCCGVTETTVRKWLVSIGFQRDSEFQRNTGTIDQAEWTAIRKRAHKRRSRTAQRQDRRLTKERVGRVISLIGEEAGIVVRQEDERTGQRRKYASAHDIRRGFAQRLINLGISAETLKVLLRHRDFVTTEKFYGAMRSAQSAGTEVRGRLAPDSPALVGGLMGGKEEAPQLTTEELLTLKSLLNSL
jgi:integrase